MTKRDQVVDYVLSNAGKLGADKIEALASVIKALGKEVEREPNAVKGGETNDENLMENSPIDMSEVTGIQVDDGPTKKVKVYTRK